MKAKAVSTMGTKQSMPLDQKAAVTMIGAGVTMLASFGFDEALRSGKEALLYGDAANGIQEAAIKLNEAGLTPQQVTCCICPTCGCWGSCFR